MDIIVLKSEEGKDRRLQNSLTRIYALCIETNLK